jgi:DNA-directed RNA polymerase specialized sigma24 family protein
MEINGLISRAKGGDEDAQDRVLSYAWEFINLFITSHIGSVVDADDLTQDAVIYVGEAIGSLVLRNGASFDDWLAGIAWKRIARYRSGEYVAGKRKGPVREGVMPYADREIPMSSIFQDGEEQALVLDETGEAVFFGGCIGDKPIRYSPEARREMEEAERAFRGN